MFMTSDVPEPFSTPSWKVEKKYSTRVLMGNWVEERRKFIKSTDPTPQSVYKKQFVYFPDYRPDQISRWYEKKREEGLTCKNLIAHHQEPSYRYLISTYDDNYNRHSYNPAMPEVRTWNRQKLLWLPEKSDFPLLAPPTNYGLFEQLKRKWLAPKTGLRGSIYATSYMSRREHAIPTPPYRLQPVPYS